MKKKRTNCRRITPLARFSYTLPPSYRPRLAVLATRENVSMSQLVRTVLGEFLRERERAGLGEQQGAATTDQTEAAAG
jgi:hypothetical protein